MVIVSHDSDNLKSPNSPSHYFQDSAIKHILDGTESTLDKNGGPKQAIGQNKTSSNQEKQSEYRKKPSQINKYAITFCFIYCIVIMYTFILILFSEYPKS